MKLDINVQQRKVGPGRQRLADTLDATEWIRALADAIAISQEKVDLCCKDCNIIIRRGTRCHVHLKAHHNALEKARARRARGAI
jgi:hypothetical protein